MKKLIALILALVMVATVATACGGKSESAKTPLAGTMEENVNKIIEKCPVEFKGGLMPVDLADTSEDGLWMLSRNTGLESAEKLKEVAVYEPMMGSIAFSLVLARVNDAADAKTVAQEMSDNIDTAKWVCVQADQKITVGYSDVVMMIMLDSTMGLNAQDYVDAFQEICGGELDFTV